MNRKKIDYISPKTDDCCNPNEPYLKQEDKWFKGMQKKKDWLEKRRITAANRNGR